MVKLEDFLKDKHNLFDYETGIHCVKCGDIWVHLYNVSIYRGDSESAVRIEGKNIVKIGEPNSLHDKLYEKCLKRGTTIMTNYVCECGCSWVHIENFHKGNILMEDVYIGEQVNPIHDLPDFKQLWRN